MYNSFAHKKNSLQLQEVEKRIKKNRKWINNYQNSVRPVLIEKYSKRINNFVIRLQEDKKQLYQYRQEAQDKAKELLKQIHRKERFIGNPHFKTKDTSDWSSILSANDRIQKLKNERMFSQKFGDSNLAFRSIASQSAYEPPSVTLFRNRDKSRQLHIHNMRFTYKSRSFSQKKAKESLLSDGSKHHLRSQPSIQQQLKRVSPNKSHIDEEVRSNVFSVASIGQQHRFLGDEVQSNISYPKEVISTQTKKGNCKKVYFKQVADLQQNSRQPQIKKSLHQILVRFGISRIKDIKKQAMVETDNLESQVF